jgi:hypothetical protein
VHGKDCSRQSFYIPTIHGGQMHKCRERAGMPEATSPWGRQILKGCFRNPSSLPRDRKEYLDIVPLATLGATVVYLVSVCSLGLFSTSQS